MLDALAAAAEALLYAGLLSCTGTVLADLTLRTSSDINRYALLVTRRGAQLTVIASLAGALILLIRLGGQIDNVTLAAVFLSNAGAAMSLQIFGAMLLLTSVGNDVFTRRMRLANAIVLIISFAFNGHAPEAGSNEAILAMVHVSAASWWIGSLWLLRYACISLPPSDIALMVMRFSAIAVQIISVLVMAGIIIAILLVTDGVTPLISPYLLILAGKIGFVSITLAIAAYNRYRLTPCLKADTSGSAIKLRRTIEAEMIIIGTILVITSILTTYTSPYEDGNGVSYF